MLRAMTDEAKPKRKGGAPKPLGVQFPANETEARLVELQRQVSLGNLAVIERNRRLLDYYQASDVSQRRLTELLNGAAIDVGDAPLTEGAVHKAIKRLRSGEVRAAVTTW